MSPFSRRWLAQIAGLTLCATAGCATTTTEPNKPIEPSAGDQPPSAVTLTDAEPQRQRVVVESVNDTVDRFDTIIRQRERAKRAAVDLKETREAAAAMTAPADDPSTIEKLAAKLREGKPIDPIPEPWAKPVAKPQAEPPAVAEASAANRPLDPNAPADADHPPADTASGALTAQTGVEVTRGGGGGAPTISRGSGVDPWLSVQQKYANRVADDPRDLSAQLDLQLSRFLHDEPVPTMSDLAALPAEDREMLAAICDALSNYRSVVRADGNPLGSVKGRPFIEMADRIRARADLTLSGLTLCTKVSSYGVYDEIKPLIFDPTAANRVVVYCEVDGFISQLNGEQKWETKLSLELKLYDDHGLQVWNVPANPTVDLAARRRRDFCLAKIITLPPNLSGGHYMLKAQVRDLLGNRVNEQTIQFAVRDNNGAGGQPPPPQRAAVGLMERQIISKVPVK